MIDRQGHERHAQAKDEALAQIGLRQRLEDRLAEVDGADERGDPSPTARLER
jgi:hypothetical protein